MAEKMATSGKSHNSKEKKSYPGGGKNSKSSSHDEMTLDKFVSKMLPLIELEKEAEITASKDTIAMLKPEVAQKRGCAILNLKCADVQTGLLGKTLLELQPNRGDILPPHKLTPHDVVVLKSNKADSTSAALGQGVVYRLKDDCITVAVDDIPEDGLNSSLRLEKVANEVTYRRLKDTLVELSKGVLQGPAADLVPVLFGSKRPTFSQKPISFSPFNKGLDNSQAAAVSKALGAHDVLLLHGPPGTGKTTAVLEIILQEVKRGSKVLACAASNIAVDNMVERLACHKVKLVRLGHPARLLPQILESSLDAQVLKGDNSSLANDIRKEIKVLNSKFLKTRDRKSRGELRRELRQLGKEERKRQQQAISDVIRDSNVILTTLTGALSRQLQDVSFDVVIIDEAAQALEVACWIALLKGRRCILAGDHLQLPPTIQSVEADKGGLGRTLFERLAAMYGNEVMVMLTVQYRMHHLIMEWSSQELYGGKIQAHGSVNRHTLYDLEDVQKASATEPTLILIDSSGCF
ncbi:hypothetical protein O6H91_23G002000 [Diphasiastrum complanatum]|uniref:Uncharacterized protein n=1 Tax=Diphasiastrum complanatum TaxID=34168 RepID=A0ACC2A7I9_DIPCM|nr:hypothetical protein O6H91_23G002000 [Diphasiastrum complanatum]